jgi:Kelch motif protein
MTDEFRRRPLSDARIDALVASLDVQVAPAPAFAASLAATLMPRASRARRLDAVLGGSLLSRRARPAAALVDRVAGPRRWQLALLLALAALLAIAIAAGTQLRRVSPYPGFRDASVEEQLPGSGGVAALLGDGRVLVVGPQQARVYDPVGRTFVAVAGGPRDTPYAMTATSLRDGRVLVTNGDGAAWTFDPATRQFAATKPMVEARHGGYTATRLDDGRVLFAGGVGAPPYPGNRYGPSLASTELFDPATNSFAASGALATPRLGPVAVLLSDGRVLVAGGTTQVPDPTPGISAFGEETLNSTELFDPRTGRFTAGASMYEHRAEFRAVRLVDGRILAVGGRGVGSSTYDSAELYEPSTNRWSPTWPPTGYRRALGAMVLPDGQVLLIGGIVPRFVGTDTSPQPTNSIDSLTVEVFDPLTKRFKPTYRENVARISPSLVLLPDGSVFVTSGDDSTDGGQPIVIPDELFGPLQ